MTKNFGFTNARLSACVAAVVGGTALSLVSTMAMAAIVDSGVVNIAIPATLDGIYLNVVTNATGVSAATAPPGWDFNPYVTGGFLTFFTSTGAANTNQVVGAAAPAGATLLAPGAVIGPASPYAIAGPVTAPAFRITSTTAFVGFQFRNEATAATNYGYAQLTTSAPNGTPAIITRYVYENTGLPITIAGGGPVATAPTLAYTPSTAAGVAFPAGPAGAATSSIGIVGTGAVGTGNTVVSGCAITGAGAASFAAPTTTPANGTFNTTTATGTINLGCTRGAAVASASLSCTETSTPGAAATRTWALTCPQAIVPAVVTPTTASGTASPLPSYNLPTGTSSRGFVFNTAGAGTTLTCAIASAKNFVVSPASLPLAVGTPGTVTVTYTGTTVGTFNATMICNTTGNAQTFTYPLSVVVGPAPVVTPTTVSGTASPLPSYNLPNSSSFRDFVFTTANANTTLTCSIAGPAGFVVSPTPLPLVVGVPGTVRVTYTGSTTGTFMSTLNCSTTGNGQAFAYPVRVTVDAVVVPVPTLSFMGSLMLLAGFLGLGMFMANRRA